MSLPKCSCDGYGSDRVSHSCRICGHDRSAPCHAAAPETSAKTDDDEVRRAEQSGLLALALGYNELAKHSTRLGDKVYWRLMRGMVVEKLDWDPFAKADAPETKEGAVKTLDELVADQKEYEAGVDACEHDWTDDIGSAKCRRCGVWEVPLLKRQRDSAIASAMAWEAKFAQLARQAFHIAKDAFPGPENAKGREWFAGQIQNEFIFAYQPRPATAKETTVCSTCCGTGQVKS